MGSRLQASYVGSVEDLDQGVGYRALAYNLKFFFLELGAIHLRFAPFLSAFALQIDGSKIEDKNALYGRSNEGQF